MARKYKRSRPRAGGSGLRRKTPWGILKGCGMLLAAMALSASVIPVWQYVDQVPPVPFHVTPTHRVLDNMVPCEDVDNGGPAYPCYVDHRPTHGPSYTIWYRADWPYAWWGPR